MKQLTEENAREYALEKFKELPELNFKWNILHSEGIIKILNILCANKDINKTKLFALAWVHDIGKTISEENHAKLSLEILKKEFVLDEVDTNCILNHGASGNPKTEEGKIFRYADGLSLFTKEVLVYRFFAEAKEGFEFEEIKERIKKIYNKYKLSYADSEEILKLLEDLYKKNFLDKSSFLEKRSRKEGGATSQDIMK
ncbi:MAG: HD domain-containing protein [Promethearchaeota archaeon]